MELFHCCFLKSFFSIAEIRLRKLVDEREKMIEQVSQRFRNVFSETPIWLIML